MRNYFALLLIAFTGSCVATSEAKKPEAKKTEAKKADKK